MILIFYIYYFYFLIIFNFSIRIITFIIHLSLFILIATILSVPVCFMCCYFKCDRRHVISGWFGTFVESFVYGFKLSPEGKLIYDFKLSNNKTRSVFRYDVKLFNPKQLGKGDLEEIETKYLSDKKQIERLQECVAKEIPFIVPNCDPDYGYNIIDDNRVDAKMILHGTDLDLPYV
eukprot:76766_1